MKELRDHFLLLFLTFTEHLFSPQELLDKIRDGEAPPLCWWSPQQRIQPPHGSETTDIYLLTPFRGGSRNPEGAAAHLGWHLKGEKTIKKAALLTGTPTHPHHHRGAKMAAAGSSPQP